MPNRIIKESICTSDTIDRLSWFEEVFFYRLIVNCDDFGRFDARPAILKARLFPLKNATENQIIDTLRKLSEVGLLIVYEYEDREYLQLKTWSDHQTIRNKRSKYPAIEDGKLSLAYSCNQLNSIESKCPRNPIQSNPNPNPNPNPIQSNPEEVSITKNEVDDSNYDGFAEDPISPEKAFEIFYKAYPRKVAKQNVLKWFTKNKPTAQLLSTMLMSLEQFKQTNEWIKDGGKFIPYPATWLNQKRWEDELEIKVMSKEEQRYRQTLKDLEGFK